MPGGYSKQVPGGYSNMFELICCECGDGPGSGYRHVAPELQRSAGPPPNRCGIAHKKHLELCPISCVPISGRIDSRPTASAYGACLGALTGLAVHAPGYPGGVHELRRSCEDPSNGL